MNQKLSVSFFCPAYQDEKNLPRLIPDIIRVFKKHTKKFEIVIVHDGSPDKTGIVADMLAKTYASYVRVVHHATNRGYGAALRSGFDHANTHEFVFYTDGDYQYVVEEIPLLLEKINGCDAVIGYRTVRRLTLARHIQTRVFNALVRLLFGIHVRDINCSMKLIRRSVLDEIHLVSDGSFIEAELLIKLMRTGKKIREVPVTHLPRKFGNASGGKPGVIFQTFAEIFSMYFFR